eukprot:2189881-Prymnesium_polylepis.1
MHNSDTTHGPLKFANGGGGGDGAGGNGGDAGGTSGDGTLGGTAGGCGDGGGLGGDDGAKQMLQPARFSMLSELQLMRPSCGTMPSGPLAPQNLPPSISIKS